jgi:hypothetical protein
MAQDATPTADVTGQEPGAGDTGQVPETSTESTTEGAKTYDEKYVKDLRSQAAQNRTRAKDAETRLESLEAELRKLQDADKTDGERLTERVTASERRASEAEARAIRYEVASAKGLDLKSAGFLTGTTREEIEAKADELAELLTDSKPSPNAGGFDGGARTTPPEKRAPEQEHNDFLMRAMGRTPTT